MKRILATLDKTATTTGCSTFLLKNAKLFVVNVFSCKSIQKWLTYTYLSTQIKHFVNADILFPSLRVLILLLTKTT